MSRYQSWLLLYAVVAPFSATGSTSATAFVGSAIATRYLAPSSISFYDSGPTFAKHKYRNKKNSRIVVAAPGEAMDEQTIMDATELFGSPEMEVNVDRAKQCAENYGMCSRQEMEVLKHDLNRVRVKNLVLNGIMTTPPPPTILVDDVGFRVLEQELELQLSLLKEHTPEPSLFPDASEDSAIGMALPHLNDPTPSDAVVDNHHSSKDMRVSAGSASIKLTPSMTLKDTIMDENVLEPLMICMAIVGLALMPQLVM